MTRERLRQVESLLLELEEERERFSREKRHRERMETTYGVGCLFGERPFEDARDRLRRIEAQCRDEQDEVRQWIDCVSDSMTRRALRLRYLDGKSWSEWEEGIRNRRPEALEEAGQKYKTDIGFYEFVQYEFFRQWDAL